MNLGHFCVFGMHVQNIKNPPTMITHDLNPVLVVSLVQIWFKKKEALIQIRTPFINLNSIDGYALFHWAGESRTFRNFLIIFKMSLVKYALAWSTISLGIPQKASAIEPAIAPIVSVSPPI